MRIAVHEADFDLQSESDLIRKRHPEIGALVSFVGLVRGSGPRGKISEMMIEHYPGMTEKALEALLVEAKNRWQIVDATLIHRVGKLPAAAQIVLVLVASHHRKDAFMAAEFIMDRLKTEAPFWKKEKTGQVWHWVEAKASDETASSGWID